jgi:hypothetical protein
MQNKSLLSTPTPAYRQAGSPSPIKGGGVLGNISISLARDYFKKSALFGMR